MATFCLTKQAKDTLRKALVEGIKNNGEMHPAKLAEMTSEERRATIAKYVGDENAKEVNALFESKLLLKNQIKGMESWAKKVTGISKEAKRDMISKIQRLDKVLSPKDENKFLHDLASTKLGLDVTPEEAKNIAELSKNIADVQDSYKANGDHVDEYGKKVVALRRYMSELEGKANQVTLKTIAQHPIQDALKIAGLSKAMTFAYDASSLFHQGGFSLLTHPLDWSKSATYAIGKAIKQFGGGHVMDEIDAKIINSKNYDKYVKMKLAISTTEDPLPSQLPEKIPLYGRGYKSTEVAFNGFLHVLRTNIADTVLKNAEKAGINIEDKTQLEALGSVINSATGRGELGAFEKVGNEVNVMFASLRNLKGDFDQLTIHAFDSKATAYSRKVAAGNLVKAIAGGAAILGIANALAPGSATLDPRSTDFGKIKIGNQRFDTPLSAEASLVTLAARVLTSSTVSATTGKVTQLNTGKFGSQTDLNVINSFFQARYSPVFGFFRDMFKGHDYNGNKFNMTNEVKNLLLPLGVQGYNQLSSDPKANQLLGIIGNEVGLFSSDYLPAQQKNWNDSPTVAQKAFKQRVGQKTFDEANQIYNTRLENATVKLQNTKPYNSMSQTDKQTALIQLKSTIQKDVFLKYGHFRYRAKRGLGRARTINEVVNQALQ